MTITTYINNLPNIYWTTTPTTTEPTPNKPLPVLNKTGLKNNHDLVYFIKFIFILYHHSFVWNEWCLFIINTTTNTTNLTLFWSNNNTKSSSSFWTNTNTFSSSSTKTKTTNSINNGIIMLCHHCDMLNKWKNLTMSIVMILHYMNHVILRLITMGHLTNSTLPHSSIKSAGSIARDVGLYPTVV